MAFNSDLIPTRTTVQHSLICVHWYDVKAHVEGKECGDRQHELTEYATFTFLLISTSWLKLNLSSNEINSKYAHDMLVSIE
jgi:hypothetical protein